MWWLNCVCVGRVLLSKLKLYKQLDIPDGGHIRGCCVWRVTRKCDSRFWGRMWPNLWSLVACLSSPPSTLGSGCYELNKYLLFLYFRYVGAAMCDSRLASVRAGCEGKCDPTSDLCSLLPLSQPTHHTAPAELDAVCATDSRAGNETSRSLKFYNHWEGHLLIESA